MGVLRRSLVVLVTAGLVFLPVAARASNPGDLDTTFGGGGTGTALNAVGSAWGAAELSDGRFVVAGVTPSGQDLVARFLADGTFDTTFGGGDGYVAGSFGSFNVQAVAIQPDGKIVIVGRTYVSNLDFAIARFKADGSGLDTTFSGDGKDTHNFFGYNDGATAVLIQPDGKIVEAGWAGTASSSDFAALRYNPNGTLDTTFGTGGVWTDDVGQYGVANAMARTSGGKLVLTGYAGSPRFAKVVRLLSNGSLDTSFDSDGVAQVDWGAGDSTASIGAVRSDGAVLIGGTSGSAQASQFALARLLPTGALDTSFGGGDGMVTTTVGTASDYLSSLAVQPDGKIVAAGTGWSNGNQDLQFAMARYLADGTLDAGFGTGGTVTTDMSSGFDDQANAVLIQPSGRIVLVGAGGSGFNELGLAGYIGDSGPGCTQFGTDGANTLTGTPGFDVLCGMDGNDILKGLGGPDYLEGGAGTDTASFAGAAVAITANLGTGSASGQGADKLFSVENLIGGAKGDTLTGNTASNVLSGLGGGDHLYGLAGADTLNGGFGNDFLYGGYGNDQLNGGPGTDACYGGPGTNTFTGCP